MSGSVEGEGGMLLYIMFCLILNGGGGHIFDDVKQN